MFRWICEHQLMGPGRTAARRRPPGWTRPQGKSASWSVSTGLVLKPGSIKQLKMSRKISEPKRFQQPGTLNPDHSVISLLQPAPTGPGGHWTHSSSQNIEAPRPAPEHKVQSVGIISQEPLTSGQDASQTQKKRRASAPG